MFSMTKYEHVDLPEGEVTHTPRSIRIPLRDDAGVNHMIVVDYSDAFTSTFGDASVSCERDALMETIEPLLRRLVFDGLVVDREARDAFSNSPWLAVYALAKEACLGGPVTLTPTPVVVVDDPVLVFTLTESPAGMSHSDCGCEPRSVELTEEQITYLRVLA